MFQFGATGGGEIADISIRPYNSVAGDYQGHRVLGHYGACSAGGLWVVGILGELAVRERAAGLYPAAGFEDGASESGEAG